MEHKGGCTAGGGTTLTMSLQGRIDDMGPPGLLGQTVAAYDGRNDDGLTSADGNDDDDMNVAMTQDTTVKADGTGVGGGFVVQKV